MTSQQIITPALLIEKDIENNLKLPTYIDLQTIVTLQRDLFVKKIGTLHHTIQDQVRSYRLQFPSQR
jgi:uncharacterized Rmd1/YagE family protein